MNAIECLKSRRRIRKHKPDPVDHSIINSIVSSASYSPSWKNTQTTRYITIEDVFIIDKIISDFTNTYNAEIVSQTSMLNTVTFVKGRSGSDFERDGSYTDIKGPCWQMFDTRAACQSFCLAAKEYGCSTDKINNASIGIQGGYICDI
jgi:hypothetical protein